MATPMIKPTEERPRWRDRPVHWNVLLAWTAATSATAVLASALALLTNQAYFALAAPIAGVVVAVIAQAVLVQYYEVVKAFDWARWFLFSLLGWVIATLLIIVAHYFWFGAAEAVYIGPAAPTLSELAAAVPTALLVAVPGAVCGAGAGYFLGGLQGRLLDRYLPMQTWVWTNSVALGLGGAVGMFVFTLFAPYGVMVIWGMPLVSATLPWVLPPVTSLLVVGLVTGTILARYISRERPAEPVQPRLTPA